MVKLVNQTIFASKIKAKKLWLFGAAEVRTLFGLSASATASLLHRYKKAGFIVQPRRGLYLLPDTLPSDFHLANRMYSPSYLSLEAALSYHGIIPETVYEITSVTPKATRRFSALGKVFSYHKIKQSAYSGYRTEPYQGVSFYIAEPEKAIVDASYLRLVRGGNQIERFNKQKLDLGKTLSYARLFGNAKLVEKIK